MNALLMRGRGQQLDAALSDADHAAPAAVARELALATRLQQVGSATAPIPTDAFRTALRTRVMAVAAVQGVGASATPTPSAAAQARSWRERAAVVGAGTLAAVVAASGVAVAGSRSLPGDPFYGVKRTVEAGQLLVASGDQDEGTRHLQFAATRLQEVRDLVLGRDAPRGAAPLAGLDAGDLENARAAMADMDDDTREGLRLLTGAFRDSRTSAPLDELRRFAARQRAGLAELMPMLGGAALAQAQRSLALVEGLQASTDELLLLVDCTAACDPSRTAPGGTGGAGALCDCGSSAPGPSGGALPPAAPGPEQQPSTQPGEPEPVPPPGGSSGPTAEPAPQPPGAPPPQPGPSLPPLPLPGGTSPGIPLPSLDVPDLGEEGVLPELDLG